MENKKSNTGLILLIIVLIILVLSLGGYIIYDKVLNKEVPTNNTDNNVIINNVTNEKYEYVNENDVELIKAKATLNVYKNASYGIVNAYIVDNKAYCTINNKLAYISDIKTKVINIKAFNQMGHNDESIAFYVIDENGNVFEVPTIMDSNTEIRKVFNEYNVKDISELNVESNDNGFEGKAVLVLQDNTVKEINY